LPDEDSVAKWRTIVVGSAEALATAFQEAARYLGDLGTARVAADRTLDELRRGLLLPLPKEPLPAEKVIADLIAATRGGHHGSAGGRFFGWVIGSALPSALAADWLTATWDQNAALSACAPAAAVVEEACGAWVKDLLQLPQEASFAITTGCQMAHVTCLAAARNKVLADHQWSVEQDGLAGSPAIRIITSELVHGSIERAVRLLGIGSRKMICLPVDESGGLRISELEAVLGQSSTPTVVVLQAGDLNIGAFDDFERIVPLARATGAWVHVDGAFGLWARASLSFRHLLEGVELADSWATDAHKWLNVPYDCGIAIVRHSDAHRAAMTHRASYIAPSDAARDQIDWNPEWSRRGRGFALYAAIRELGASGLESLIERTCKHAQTLARGIATLPHVELIADPLINQGLVAFKDPAGTTALDDDLFTDRVIAAVNEGGEAFFSGTTWKGRRSMRISVCSWRTTDDDVARAVAAVERVLCNLTK
jgi:glutamate/tyrosine decarboxylase-like PLP-dependent enzyme